MSHALQFLILVMAGWVNRQQQEAIEYLRTENQILKESHGKRRIRLAMTSGDALRSRARS